MRCVCCGWLEALSIPQSKLCLGTAFESILNTTALASMIFFLSKLFYGNRIQTFIDLPTRVHTVSFRCTLDTVFGGDMKAKQVNEKINPNSAYRVDNHSSLITVLQLLLKQLLNELHV